MSLCLSVWISKCQSVKKCFKDQTCIVPLLTPGSSQCVPFCNQTWLLKFFLVWRLGVTRCNCSFNHEVSSSLCQSSVAITFWGLSRNGNIIAWDMYWHGWRQSWQHSHCAAFLQNHSWEIVLNIMFDFEHLSKHQFVLSFTSAKKEISI